MISPAPWFYRPGSTEAWEVPLLSPFSGYVDQISAAPTLIDPTVRVGLYPGAVQPTLVFADLSVAIGVRLVVLDNPLTPDQILIGAILERVTLTPILTSPYCFVHNGEPFHAEIETERSSGEMSDDDSQGTIEPFEPMKGRMN